MSRYREPKLGERLFNKIDEILNRYNDYSNFLKFPYEWGERAFRGWIVYEIFHEILSWPIKNIVFGEQFDVLLVDEHIMPRIYLETKKPGRGLAELDDFKARARFYGTLRYAVITDGYIWAKYEPLGEKIITERLVIDIYNSQPALLNEFFISLHACKFLKKVSCYGEQEYS